MTRADQRRALRLPVPAEQEEAELRWQDVDYPARVTDQSAGGFGVQLECPIDIQANQVAALIWGEGCSPVRVVNRIDEGSFIRLGLERIDDPDAADDFDPHGSIWSRRPRLPMPGSNLSQYVLGVLVVLGCALAGMAWELLPHHQTVALHAPSISAEQQAKNAAAAAAARHRAAKSVEQISAFWHGDPVNRALDSTNLPHAARKWVAQQVQVIEGVVYGILRAMASAPVDTRRTSLAVQKATADTADAISRAASLGSESIVGALPRFMNLLQLSDRQRRDLDEVIRSAHEATQEVHRRVRELGTQQAMHEIERIRQTAGDSALALLSPAQAEKLRSLISNSRSSRPKTATSQGKPTSK